MSFDNLIEAITNSKISDNKAKILKTLKKAGINIRDVDITNLTPEQIKMLKERKLWNKISEYYPNSNELKNSISKRIINCLDKHIKLPVNTRNIAADYINKFFFGTTAYEPKPFNEVSADIISFLRTAQKKEGLAKELGKDKAAVYEGEIESLISNGLVKQSYISIDCPIIEVTKKGVEELVNYLCKVNNFNKNDFIEAINKCNKRDQTIENETPKAVIDCLVKYNLIMKASGRLSDPIIYLPELASLLN